MSDVKKTHIHLLSPGPHYDPDKHITLDELRELGVRNLPLEQDIPGCAWLPRTAMQPDPSSIKVQPHDPDDPQKMKITMPLNFTQALTWETTTVVVDGDVDIEDLKKTLEDVNDG